MINTQSEKTTSIRDARNRSHPYMGSVVATPPTPPITPMARRKQGTKNKVKENESSSIDASLDDIEGDMVVDHMEDSDAKAFEGGSSSRGPRAKESRLAEIQRLQQLEAVARRLNEIHEVKAEVENKKKFLENQKELLECPGCKKVMGQPFILDCGHQLCRVCLQRLKMDRLMASEESSEKTYNALECPVESCGKAIMYGPWGSAAMGNIASELGKVSKWKNMSQGDPWLFWFDSQVVWKGRVQERLQYWKVILRRIENRTYRLVPRESRSEADRRRRERSREGSN
ncbi:Tripartite motif-containing protein [Marasmius tenuissimus]|uniref:Tripartite motif-containing protein n=1 Tax=Marasmius tenuissimus TaxID=585030 RepID=A0ABR3A3P1_9AGAR|nr:hypothetical protein PM082_023329 [Marasmius tenuissimus]